MFDLVPPGGVECQFIECRQVPEHVGGGEGDPADHGIKQHVSDSFQRRPNEKGSRRSRE